MRYFPYVIVTDDISFLEKHGVPVNTEGFSLSSDIKEIYDQLFQLWVLEDRLFEEAGENFSKNSLKYDLLPIECRLYVFLDPMEREFHYFSLRGISQEIVGEFYNKGQSVVSFRGQRLNKKLMLVFERSVRLLFLFQKNYYYLLFTLTCGEVLFLQEVLICMDKVKLCRVLGLSSFLVTKIFLRILTKLTLNPLLYDFLDQILSLFRWGMLGREFYKKKK